MRREAKKLSEKKKGGGGGGEELRGDKGGKIKFSPQSNDSYHKRKKLLKLTMGSRIKDFRANESVEFEAKPATKVTF